MTIPNVYVHHVSRHVSGMYGVMLNSEELPIAVTLQPDDKFLAPGVYSCRRDYYHAGNYPTFEIFVEGHTRVLFHKGNWERHSKLCILVAESYEPLFDKKVGNIVPGVADSAGGFEDFWNYYKDYETINLVVSARRGVWPLQ